MSHQHSNPHDADDIRPTRSFLGNAVDDALSLLEPFRELTVLVNDPWPVRDYHPCQYDAEADGGNRESLLILVHF